MKLLWMKIATALAMAGLCAPTLAQDKKISALPAASTLTGPEKLSAVQGAGCASSTTPCANVVVTPAQIATYVATASPLTSAYQPLDSDLTSIAALSTTSFGRSLLTQADASALRTTAGLGSIATQGAGAVSITGGSIAGITDLAVADGGTGASTASGARTNLGLVIGTDVQTQDSDLDAIAALTTTSFGRSTLAVADAAALRTLAGSVIGTDVQGYNANLAAISGLTTAADKLTYWTGSGTASTTDLSTFGRTLIDDVDAAAARATIGAVSTAGDTITGSLLTISNPTTNGNAIYATRAFGSGGNGRFDIEVAGGTYASPAAVAQNAVLGNVRWRGYTGASYVTAVDQRGTITAATPSATDMQSRWSLLTVGAGSVSLTEVLRAETATGLSMFGANPVIDQNRNHVLRTYTVATLPASPATGTLAQVSDANATTFNSTVAGGGSNVMMVRYNGTNWVIT